VSTTEVGALAPQHGPARSARDETLADVRAATALAVGLLIIGALLGLAWSAWSPVRPAALILKGGQIEVLAENESLVAADGRYLVIIAAVGVLATLFAWFGLARHRGATLMLGLAVGTMGGAALTELIGRVSGGGSFHGRPALLSDGSRQNVTVHLPLSLHIPWLVVLETVIAALVYGLLVAFAARDDLGRPDPLRDDLLSRRGPGPDDLVDAGRDPEDGRGDGDAARAPEQGDLPPQ
jgi:hypothetical protein